MTEADFSLLCNRTGDAECLQADTDSGCCVRCVFDAFFESNRNAEGISPNCVVECDRLNALYDAFNINAFFFAKSLRVFKACDAVLGKACFDLGHSSLFAFKFYVISHCAFLL